MPHALQCRCGKLRGQVERPERANHVVVHTQRVAIDIRPGVAVDQPVVVAEDAVVAAVTMDLRRRVMVADAVELDDQPLGEVDVV